MIDIRDLIGVPFAHRGRDPSRGLDCLGLLLEVYRRAGIQLREPHVDYDLFFAERDEDLLDQHWPMCFKPIVQPTRELDVAFTGKYCMVPQHVIVMLDSEFFANSTQRHGVHMVRRRAVHRFIRKAYRFVY